MLQKVHKEIVKLILSYLSSLVKIIRSEANNLYERIDFRLLLTSFFLAHTSAICMIILTSVRYDQ